MGESRSSESRGSYYYEPSYSSYSSESRSSESRDYGYTSESREIPYYNRLEDIDTLIERLSSKNYNTKSEALNRVMTERKAKIEQLRSLKEQVLQKCEEERIIEQIKNENLELDKAIKDLKENYKEVLFYGKYI